MRPRRGSSGSARRSRGTAGWWPRGEGGLVHGGGGLAGTSRGVMTTPACPLVSLVGSSSPLQADRYFCLSFVPQLAGVTLVSQTLVSRPMLLVKSNLPVPGPAMPFTVTVPLVGLASVMLKLESTSDEVMAERSSSMRVPTDTAYVICFPL